MDCPLTAATAIQSQHKLDKQEIELLAMERFNVPVKALNKLQASGLIEELLQGG